MPFHTSVLRLINDKIDPINLKDNFTQIPFVIFLEYTLRYWYDFEMSKVIIGSLQKDQKSDLSDNFLIFYVETAFEVVQ